MLFADVVLSDLLVFLDEVEVPVNADLVLCLPVPAANVEGIVEDVVLRGFCFVLVFLTDEDVVDALEVDKLALDEVVARCLEDEDVMVKEELEGEEEVASQEV